MEVHYGIITCLKSGQKSDREDKIQEKRRKCISETNQTILWSKYKKLIDIEESNYAKVLLCLQYSLRAYR